MLGVALGVAPLLGTSLGAALGTLLGGWLGVALGTALGPLPGAELGDALGGSSKQLSMTSLITATAFTSARPRLAILAANDTAPPVPPDRRSAAIGTTMVKPIVAWSQTLSCSRMESTTVSKSVFSTRKQKMSETRFCVDPWSARPRRG